MSSLDSASSDETETPTQISPRSLLGISRQQLLAQLSAQANEVTQVQTPWGHAIPKQDSGTDTSGLDSTGAELSLPDPEHSTTEHSLVLEALTSAAEALPAAQLRPPPALPRIESLLHTRPAFEDPSSEQSTVLLSVAAPDEALEQADVSMAATEAGSSSKSEAHAWTLFSSQDKREEPQPGDSAEGSFSSISFSPHAMSGVVLGGRYRLEAMVGVGGMGSVYRARDLELDEPVALKMLRREKINHPGVLARFRQEVKLARRVTHRNIARMFDLGEHQGEKFLTMEFIEGETVTVMQSRVARPSLDQVLQIGLGICEGLSAAHDVGVIHRDLKPDNVMIQADGRVVITDFGIAWSLSELGSEDNSDTKTGTPIYMAPEQVESQPLSPQTDLYALGELLYQLVVGGPPWQASTLGGLLMKRLHLPPPNPAEKRPELPSSFCQLIQHLMATRPEDRPESARWVSSRLKEVQGELEPSSLKGGQEPPGPRRVPTLQELAARAYAGAAMSPQTQRSLAVLPLRNVGQAEDAYLAEGLTEDLQDSLSMVPELRVLSRQRTRALGAEGQDPLALGRALGVQAVLDGTLRRLGDQFRLGLRLTSTQDGIQFWTRRYNVPGGELLVLSEQVAQEVTRMLQGTQQPTVRQAVTDPRAIELYLKARHLYHGAWSSIVLQSQALFEQAYRLAPQDPLLKAGYALSLARRFVLQKVEPEHETLCRQLAEQALAQAPNLAEAHMTLAWLNLNQALPAECGKALRRTIQSAPSLPDGYDLAGQLLLEIGDIEQGTALIQTSLLLEPRLIHSRRHLARIISMQGRVDEAIEILAPMLESPDTVSAAGMSLARVLVWHRRSVEARHFRQRLETKTFSGQARILAILDAACGQPPLEYLRSIQDMLLENPDSFRVKGFLHQLSVELYLVMGDVAQALPHLQAANQAKLLDLFWLESCPLLEPLRARPEFERIHQDFQQRRTDFLSGLQGT